MSAKKNLSQVQSNILEWLAHGYVIESYFTEHDGYVSAFLRKHLHGLEIDQQALPLRTFRALLGKEAIEEKDKDTSPTGLSHITFGVPSRGKN